MMLKNAGCTFWRLTAFVEHGKREVPVPGTEITLIVSPEAHGQGTISGSAGCNQYGATYTISPASGISISRPWSTLIACLQPGVMEQESRYLGGLPAVTEIEIKSDMLILRWDDGAFEFEAVEAQAC